MAWLAVNKNGQEVVFYDYPERGSEGFETNYWICGYDTYTDWGSNITKGSIQKLIGRELTWNDEPVEI